MSRNAFRANKAGWQELARQIIETEGVARMRRVADACNQGLSKDGFLVSVEGDNPLDKRDYRATVITATAEAKAKNAKHNTLVNNFYRAGGD